jgi:hypothetical protein
MPWFSGLFGASSPSSPEVALIRDEETKIQKYSEGVRSHPDTRLILFVVAQFGALDGHATAFLTYMARQATASKGIHVGKLLAFWRRKLSLAVHVGHAGN